MTNVERDESEALQEHRVRAGSTPSAFLAELMPGIRQRQGLSAAGFSERAREVGLKLDRGQVSKIETGQRGVSLDEALALAVALDVAPANLFFAREDDTAVHVAPDVPVNAAQARAWFRGDAQLPGRDDKTYSTEVPQSEWNRRNRELSDTRKEWLGHRRRYLVAGEKLTFLSDRLGQLDEIVADETTQERAMRTFGGGVLGGGRRNPAEEERDRLAKMYDVALLERAEAKVDMSDARDRYEALKAELGAIA